MRAYIVLVFVFGCSEPPPPVLVQAAPQVSAPAQGAKISVDDEGARIETPGARVEANQNGARVAAGNVEVRANDQAVVIGAGDTQIRVDDQGVTIPGLGRIAAPQGGTMSATTSTRLVVCNGSDRVVRNNAVLDGGALPAISASGSCTVTCNNCTIRSSVVAIAASGSSRITLNGGTVRGNVAAIAGSGSTEVTTNATHVQGAVTRSGNAVVRRN